MALRSEQTPLVLESFFSGGNLRSGQAALIIETSPGIPGHIKSSQAAMIYEITPGSATGIVTPPISSIGSCNPILKDPFGGTWTLGITDDGTITITSISINLLFQNGPIVLSRWYRIPWQLSVDSNFNLT